VFNAGLLPFTDSTGDKSRVDQITDYQIGVDYIDVNVAGANFFANVGGTTELIAALQFGGGAAGRIVYDKSEALLYVDTDGDGVINIDQSDIIVWMVGLEGQNLNGGYIGNF
jgi:hypothetical protein